MPSGQTIINNALTILGILEQGGSPSSSDSVDALAELNSMWDAWSIDEGLIYSIASISKALTTATASYTIGSGASFNVTRPGRLYKAFFTLSGGRNEIDIVNAQKYYSHNDLSASAVAPDEVYADFNVDPTTGYGKVYLWPVPAFTSPTPSLELEVGVAFTAWTLAGVTVLPYGYQDAIQYALAWRLLPRFGQIVPQEIAQVIAGVGQKAEQRIREMNAMNRQAPPEAMAVPNTMPQQKAV